MEFQLHSDLGRDGIAMGNFPLCQVLLINDSRYPWFVLVPQRAGVSEIYELSEQDHGQLWMESREFGKTIKRVFQGDKLNVAALGNVTPQLHVHHVVRYRDDAAWPAPIWGKGKGVPYTDDALARVLKKLQLELSQLPFKFAWENRFIQGSLGQEQLE